MDYIIILGLVAGVCTTIAVIPQIKKSWRNKEVEDISPLMFIILVTGLSLWTVYGIIKKDIPIILTNGTSLMLNGIMLYLMMRYRKK
ncbi:hypothetical protein ED312_10445 [Sinomicrobium pectinilyticum]|uniref:MtN3 and saliva related transmembrane protein n=1 Tax=Sinomicrobium pectinilyticum TaxID=1084421 RepID=A0A3N0EHB5_SINP1|nr:SemiSWEET transporter [Sinomicrobium pectinilyticum]RNL87222.1 hypothetical protein ED312_10445 [Sinomicrobium pectinilyticum]